MQQLTFGSLRQQSRQAMVAGSLLDFDWMAAIKLFGLVDSQSLTGIAHLHRLRNDPKLAVVSAAWPFETGWATKSTPPVSKSQPRLVWLSSIADEMREEHRPRVLGE